jgi:hypothetical protein
MSRRAVFHVAAAVVLTALAFSQPRQQSHPQQRNFTFTYAFSVRGVEAGKPLRVWFPKAHSDRYQKVRLLSATGDLPLKETREGEYGNEMFYAATNSATKAEYHFQAKYEVVRYERPGFEEASARPAEVKQAALKRYLEPDRLVPISGKPAELAAAEVQGKNTPLEKARAIYDYVFKTMRYDKTGTGWGRGDTLWACDAKRGNCTDFHSLFASMARSQGIPTRFEIGFPLPAEKHEAEIAGYHCWSDFYIKDKGWIPIDISEAWKHQEKKDYFFGAHDVNRVQFSVGRDIILSPKQAGQPLNYFVYPYAESAGKEVQNVKYEFAFQDARPTVQAQAREPYRQ